MAGVAKILQSKIEANVFFSGLLTTKRFHGIWKSSSSIQARAEKSQFEKTGKTSWFCIVFQRGNVMVWN